MDYPKFGASKIGYIIMDFINFYIMFWQLSFHNFFPPTYYYTLEEPKHPSKWLKNNI